MKVTDYLREDVILLDIGSADKETTIKMLAEKLTKAPGMLDYNRFLQDVFAREKVGSTGIGSFVALPHARTEAVSDLMIVFGRSAAGIDFDSVDDKPAKLIFLLATPKEKGLNIYLQLLAHLSRVLVKEDFQNKLFAATSAEEVIGAFKHYGN